MKRHLLERHGVKWPPGYLTGDCAPCCNPPPPPPPPPPGATQYYYRRRTCGQCAKSDGTGGTIPSAFQLEVDGFTNYTGGAPGYEGTSCDGNNGTFILDFNPAIGDLGLGCSFSSPIFVATAVSIAGEHLCLNDAEMRYVLQFQKIPLLTFVRLNLVSLAYGNIVTWQKSIPEDTCDSILTLPFYSSLYGLGYQSCCESEPMSVTLYPL